MSPNLQNIPSVDKLLNLDPINQLIQIYGRSLTIDCIRIQLDIYRKKIIQDQINLLSMDKIIDDIRDVLIKQTSPSFKQVYNLTGTILHTNLGRAILPEKAIQAVVNAMKNPSNLEYEIENGKRGDRDVHLRDIVQKLTSAEDVTVVNNNAAAVFLCLNTLGLKKEVIVSRGELIEIGGSFRLPDIMKRAGSKLVEVGTTNRTHRVDYETAITKQTGLLLKAHTSNYLIEGFTKSVSVEELASIGQKFNIPTMYDLGSGSLVNFKNFGLPSEPTISEILKQGVDIVTFSGDKLLGSTQAGIIVGKKEWIQKIKKNPLKRILRVGKMTIACLESTLRLYLNPDTLSQELPTLKIFTRPKEDIFQTCIKIKNHLDNKLSHCTISIIESNTEIGSGSLPSQTIPTFCIKIESTQKSLTKIENSLRKLPIPIIARMENKSILFDMRMIFADEESIFIENLNFLE